MSAFEPDTVIAILQNTLDASKRKDFETSWRKEVEDRWRGWKKKRSTQSQYQPQLEWEAHVVEYVNFVHKQTKLHGGSRNIFGANLSKAIPLFGPRFVPSSYLQVYKRKTTPEIKPDISYLKPLNIVHPFYYPELTQCPQCDSENISWSGWTATGHREVHGINREETALGYQLRCKACEVQYRSRASGAGSGATGSDGDAAFCFCTTNHMFWERWEHWEVPYGIPYFLKRCAVTRELFDIIIELRPTMTAGGLAENFKQMHLLEYHKQQLTYLRFYKLRQSQMSLVPPPPLRTFSKPDETTNGYCDQSITDDLITDVFAKFSDRTRQSESQDYLRTLSAICISLDNTFRIAGKASIVETEKNRVKLMKGGVLSVINEINEIISWRFCQSQSNAEIVEVLTGLKTRNVLLGVADPEMAVVDNCCHVRSGILKVFPAANILLDVWHFTMRYLVCVMNGTKNPLRSAVAQDLVDAILKSKADKHNFATYWSKAEQERRLISVYEKWSKNGNVWTAAAAKTHTDQLTHVRKGCLARPRQDVRSDGSRIEGTHKGWNGLQRAHASGLSVLTALCHDYVLRRNIRVAFHDNTPQPNTFLLLTYGSHHIRLVDAIAKLWNLMLKKSKVKPSQHIQTLPELRIITSVEIKDEPDNELLDLSSQDEDVTQMILRDMNIDPQLLLQPLLLPPAGVTDATQTQHNTLTGIQDVSLVDPRPASVSIHTSNRPSPSSPVMVETVQVSREGGSAISKAYNTSSHIESSVKNDVQESAPCASPSDDLEVTYLGTVQHPNPIFRPQQKQAVLTPPPTPSTSALKRKVDSAAFEADSGVVSETSRKKKRTERSPSFAAKTTSSSSRLARTRGMSHGGKPSTGAVHRFFAVQESVLKSSASSPKEAASLPNLPLLSVSGDTPSQRLFSIAAGIHPRSMTLSSNEEFYLFMDMRYEKKWASFEMSPRKWVIAANEYNARLEALNRSRGSSTVRKTPRALMDKLGEIEPKILARNASGRYTSQRSNSEDFWKKHCGAVQLIRTGSSDKKRKINTCTRCKTIMWPGPKGSTINHNKGYCSDGVLQKPKKVENTVGDRTDWVFKELPPWPQPRGIFAGGNQFSPGTFLDAVQQMYTQLVVEKDSGGELSMEYYAFAALLEKRLTVTADGLALFELYHCFTYPSTHSEFIIERNGIKYLRVDSLHEGTGSTSPEPEIVPGRSGSVVPITE